MSSKGLQYRIFADYHTHTYYSHGRGTPRDIVLAAIEKGLDEVAISEHGGGHMLYGVRGRALDRLNGEVDVLRREFEGRIRVLRGAELNVTGFGKCDCPPDRDSYDIITIGYHKGIAPINAFSRGVWAESMFRRTGDPHKNAESILAAAEKCRANVISHPNLYVKVDIPYLAKCAKQMGIMLEINSSRVTLSNDEIKLAANEGCGLVIGSDAHSPERVGDFEKAISAVAECGVWESIRNARKIAE